MVTGGLRGLLHSSVELARRLAADGHHLTYVSSITARELVEHQGLGFLELPASRYDEFLESDATTGGLSRLLNLRRRRSEATESLALDSFVKAVHRLAPNLVLIDGEMHEHILALAPLRVPTALLNTFVSIWRRPGLPPPHHFVRPGVGWWGTTWGMSMLWLALRWRKSYIAARQAIRRTGCDRLSILRHLARETGFDLRHETDRSQWLIPFTYRRLPVLSLHALEFEFPHLPTPGVHYLGPMVLESRIDPPLGDGDRTTLEATLERRRRAGEGGRLICAAFGSVFTTDLDLLRRLIGVVTERPEWELLISLSHSVEPADLGDLPERVNALPWVPQVRVLQLADAIVTHGGINTIDECVIHGVPALVYCGHQTDMAGTTARVVHHGIGIAGDADRDSTAVIRKHLDRLLNEPRFADNLRRLRGFYTVYSDNRVAQRIVESLLDTGGGYIARESLTGGDR